MFEHHFQELFKYLNTTLQELFTHTQYSSSVQEPAVHTCKRPRTITGLCPLYSVVPFQIHALLTGYSDWSSGACDSSRTCAWCSTSRDASSMRNRTARTQDRSGIVAFHTRVFVATLCEHCLNTV